LPIVTHTITTTSSSTLADIGSVAAVVTAVAVGVSLAAWIGRRSRRWVFPDLRIDITGWGTEMAERVVQIPGTSNTLGGGPPPSGGDRWRRCFRWRARVRQVPAPRSLTEYVWLRLMFVSITSREPDRNSVLSFSLRYRGTSGAPEDEVIWTPLRWDVALQRRDVLRGPVAVARETAVAGVLAFEPSPFPVDPTDRGRLQVFDYISRTRVRLSTDMGTHDRGDWEYVDHRHFVPAWWQRIIEREERLSRQH
jgi:hypothetical protein